MRAAVKPLLFAQRASVRQHRSVRCIAMSASGEGRPLHILAISGSLRASSCNTGLLRACAKRLPPKTTMEVYVPLDLPLFSQDLETGTLPPSVVALQQKVRKADAFVFACTEYNYSMSAALKNAIDWASRGEQPHGFWNKPAAVVSAAGGVGGLRAQMHFRDTALFLNLHVMNEPALMIKIFEDPKPFDFSTGELKDEALLKRTESVMTALAEWTHRLNP